MKQQKSAAQQSPVRANKGKGQDKAKGAKRIGAPGNSNHAVIVNFSGLNPSEIIQFKQFIKN